MDRTQDVQEGDDSDDLEPNESDWQTWQALRVLLHLTPKKAAPGVDFAAWLAAIAETCATEETPVMDKDELEAIAEALVDIEWVVSKDKALSLSKTGRTRTAAKIARDAAAE